MYGIFEVIFWALTMILALTWLFLPWIIISKMDQVISQLNAISQLLTRAR